MTDNHKCCKLDELEGALDGARRVNCELKDRIAELEAQVKDKPVVWVRDNWIICKPDGTKYEWNPYDMSQARKDAILDWLGDLATVRVWEKPAEPLVVTFPVPPCTCEICSMVRQITKKPAEPVYCPTCGHEVKEHPNA